MLELGLPVTGKCNWACKNCSQEEYKKDFCDYDLSMQRVYAIRKRMLQLGIMRVRFTGGEPTMWKNFVQAVKAFHSKGIFVSVNTNQTGKDVLDEVAGMIKIYPNNQKNHRTLPSAPIYKIPAKCMCPRITYIEGRMYPCGNAYALSKRYGIAVPTCSVAENWEEFFQSFNKFEMDICKYCHSNFHR